MSVRSFDQIVGSPDPIKLSTILQEVRTRMARDRWCSYICNVARHVGEDMGLDGTETRNRVSRFLEQQGVETAGHWFGQRAGVLALGIWAGEDLRGTATALAQRTARLAVLDVLIDQLQQRGE